MSELINLNKEQLEAINTKDGNLLILASAGTGKTTTIVERYINLVENHGLNHDEIMMTTFTNKAAKDMIKKISKKTRKLPNYIGTLHSLFLKILRGNHEKLPIRSNFTLLTEESDKKKIIKKILEEKKIIPTRDNVLYFFDRINRFKNAGILAEDLNESSDMNDLNKEILEEIEGEVIRVSSKIKREAVGVYKKYQESLRLSNMLDFDDILLLTYVLLEKNPEIRKQYLDKFKIIMVDEAQDLNVVQIKILDLLENDNLCLIGDDCQNIYAWRGASNDLIFKFDKKHKKITLKDNYRSTEEIIKIVNKIINSLSFKIDKQLNCTRDEGNQIKIQNFYSFNEEIDFLVTEVKRLIQKSALKEEIAILFRTNNLGKQIERAFRRSKIPCHLSKSRGFFEREEVRDILAFLRLKINPYSFLEFERVLSLIEGVGQVKIVKLHEIALKNNCSILESLNYLDQININSELKTNLIKLKVTLDDSTKDPIESFLKFFNYHKYLSVKYRSDSEKFEDKEENIETIRELYEGYTLDKKGITTFLDSLIEMEKKEKDKDKVILTTIHGAKGLEWKHVFLAGCNEKILPFYFDSLSKIKRDEELRLFYVAVSRAKDFLTITYSNNHDWRWLEPSQFIKIINPKIKLKSRISFRKF